MPGEAFRSLMAPQAIEQWYQWALEFTQEKCDALGMDQIQELIPTVYYAWNSLQIRNGMYRQSEQQRNKCSRHNLPDEVQLQLRKRHAKREVLLAAYRMLKAQVKTINKEIAAEKAMNLAVDLDQPVPLVLCLRRVVSNLLHELGRSPTKEEQDVLNAAVSYGQLMAEEQVMLCRESE